MIKLEYQQGCFLKLEDALKQPILNEIKHFIYARTLWECVRKQKRSQGVKFTALSVKEELR